MNRRRFLKSSSLGFGMLGLQSLAHAGRSRVPHHAPKAKSVILVYLSGGLSQVDSFDPKPMLQRMAGEPMPIPVKGTMFDNVGTIMPSPWEFRQRGESGLAVSELFPHIATMADELCVVRSMTSKASEHAQGNFFFHSGFSFQGHPSAGAWMSYGLGCDAEDLPAYVVLRSGGATDPIGGASMYGNGFLPAEHQASFLKVDSDSPLPNLKPSESPERQQSKIAAMKTLDRAFNNSLGGADQIEAAIKHYETAFRMQASVPEACDLTGETALTRRLYGLDHANETTRLFGQQCLVARRLVERGVRFVELSCLQSSGKFAPSPNPWDQHGKLKEGHGDMAQQVDQPVAGLLKDLKARGMLYDTIVIFSGEFGRTSFAQGSDGRDHDPYGYSLWMAGGGFKGGYVHGATDEFGYHVVENEVNIYSLWATVQHQLGLDHENVIYHFAGRDYRLSDVEGHVINDLLA